MTNSFSAGSIQTNAAGFYRTPSFLVMTLYRTHSRPLPLRLAADVPVNVDVTACASEDKTGVTIFAVNPRNEPVRFVLDLTDFGSGFSVRGGEVIKDAQDRRQSDIINSFADPHRVVKVKFERESGNIVTIPALSIVAIDCSR